MTDHQHQDPYRVVVAGGGVAGLEAVIALHHLAGGRVVTTLVAPDAVFELRALSVREPFGGPGPARYDVDRLCRDHGAAFVRSSVERVRPASRSVSLQSGRSLTYDALLVAVGARATPFYEGVPTFRGLQDAGAVQRLLQDLHDRRATSVAFVVPPVATWPLPAYELALMTAEWAGSLPFGVALTVVTSEPTPLAAFGRESSETVERALHERGIAVHSGVEATVRGELIADAHGARVARADRIVAVPCLQGRAVSGLPWDDDGFLPVDERCAVPGAPGVLGAGDGTTCPIKQGGVAAQHAGTAAHAIVRRAGLPVEVPAFRPALRAQLLTGHGATYLRWAGASPEPSTASEHALWWPPTKVAAPYLGPYLVHVSAGGRGPAPEPRARVLHEQGDPAGGIEVLGS